MTGNASCVTVMKNWDCGELRCFPCILVFTSVKSASFHYGSMQANTSSPYYCIPTTFVTSAPLRYTLPRLIEPVALRFPELRFILAHLGHPYTPECMAVIRKQPHVY